MLFAQGVTARGTAFRWSRYHAMPCVLRGINAGVCLASAWLMWCLVFYLSICLSLYVFVYWCLCVSIFLLSYLLVCLHTYLCSVLVCVYLPFFLCICLSVFTRICVLMFECIYLSFMFICLSVLHIYFIYLRCGFLCKGTTPTATKSLLKKKTDKSPLKKNLL